MAREVQRTMGDVIENGRDVTGIKNFSVGSQEKQLCTSEHLNIGKKREPTMQTCMVKKESAALLANILCLAPAFSQTIPSN